MRARLNKIRGNIADYVIFLFVALVDDPRVHTVIRTLWCRPAPIYFVWRELHWQRTEWSPDVLLAVASLHSLSGSALHALPKYRKGTFI